METKTTTFEKFISKKFMLKLVIAFGLMSIGILAPLLKQQMLTGPIVNACLFTGAILLDSGNAVFIGLMPSLIALSVGLLPAVLAPMVPFLMAGNAILILVFSKLKEKNYWLGVVLASIVKFVFLFIAGFFVSNLIAKKEIATQAASMMSWPQLATALLGGVIAYLLTEKVFRV